MHGSLEPDERVLEPESYNVEMLKGIYETIEKLGWEETDNVVVEVGGTVVSGIHQGENYNKKWATQYGTRKYNKDAFIVIKNLSRTPFESSKPMDRDHKPQHPYEPVTNV